MENIKTNQKRELAGQLFQVMKTTKKPNPNPKGYEN